LGVSPVRNYAHRQRYNCDNCDNSKIFLFEVRGWHGTGEPICPFRVQDGEAQPSGTQPDNDRRAVGTITVLFQAEIPFGGSYAT
jgi:hypothetical protein